ncbi:MAG TPA: NADPH:quinone reductase [Burkholderiaceae bacterium]|nr:NADPH:quinone reductase [Burkholderiaceae bacterium]
MKAAYYEAKGPAREVLRVGERPLPQPAAGEVRVRVHVSAVNPSDTKARGGARVKEMPFPVVIPHQDGAGVIDAVGAGVDAARIGQRVWVYEANLNRPFGTAAQYTCVPAHKAVTLPGKVDFTIGACMGIPAMTAHRCVFADGTLEGKTVLVHGGAGAVGYYAVQFAKLGGAARVIATVSRAEQAERAREAGADALINYRSEDVSARVGEICGTQAAIDRVVDVAFGANLATNLAVLRPSGVIATYASDAVPEPKLPFWQLLFKDVTVRFVLVYAMPAQAHAKAAAFITDALERGVLKHQIHRVFTLDEIVAAHEATETMANVGKVLVRVD